MFYNTYAPGSFQKTSGLDYDVVRTEDGVTLFVDIPGINPADVDLTVDGRSLRLAASRTTSIPENAKVVSRGRRNGDLSQAFQLGEQLDAERLTADYANGVLIVTIPVAESAKPRKVEVGVGAPAIDAASDVVSDVA